MELIPHIRLTAEQKVQYHQLIHESVGEASLYGVPLNPLPARQVVIVDGKVVGAFEYGQGTYDGKTYHRTNRPYVLREYRGNGIMQIALESWYKFRRPAMAWIDDDNIASIRLFQNVGFRKTDKLFHKEKDGHVYILSKDA